MSFYFFSMSIQEIESLFISGFVSAVDPEARRTQLRLLVNFAIKMNYLHSKETIYVVVFPGGYFRKRAGTVGVFISFFDIRKSNFPICFSQFMPALIFFRRIL